MPKEAMNLTFGDFIIIEIALVHYIKGLDLSMQSGQYISELLGKIEYELAEIRQNQNPTKTPPVDAPPNKPEPLTP